MPFSQARLVFSYVLGRKCLRLERKRESAFLRVYIDDESESPPVQSRLTPRVLRVAGGARGQKGRSLRGDHGATGATLLPSTGEDNRGDGHAEAEKGANGIQQRPKGGSQSILKHFA